MSEFQTILYLTDGDLLGNSLSVRITGGLRSDHLASDLAGIERQARLIIEQYKLGMWAADPSPQMSGGFDT